MHTMLLHYITAILIADDLAGNTSDIIPVDHSPPGLINDHPQGGKSQTLIFFQQNDCL